MVKYLATLFLFCITFSCLAMHDAKEFARVQLIILKQEAKELDQNNSKTNCNEDYLRGYIQGMCKAYQEIIDKY